jgi:acyl-CoA synthetase (AMP-forming)/AMP-acid ligase II
VSSSTETDPDTQVWGSEIEQVDLGGVSFRMYTQRPRRLGGLLDYAARWAEKPHIVQGERVVTFADVRAAAASKSAELAGQGIGAGDRVFILGFNSPEWVINFWAIVSLGAVPVLANAWWSPQELEHAVTLLDPQLVLADTRGARIVPAGVRTGSWAAPEAAAPGPAPADPSDAENDPAVIIFTSGTEGHPKAVVLSHRSLLAGLQMLLHITRRLPHQVPDDSGDTSLHTGPMFHIGGVQTLLRAVIVGDTLVMPAGRFDPAEAMALIEQWKISRWSAVPTMASRVLDHPDVHTRDLRSLRALTVGGAPVGAEFLARLRTGMPGVEPRIATGYGLTENGGQAVAASGKDTTNRPGCVGRPLPCVELKIGSSEYSDGEILIRSPTQMSGYVGPGVSPIDADGWLHTGDLGRIDEDGFLWITGRSKEMIIRGGENIAPAAVEASLTKLDGVSEAVVFGIPDPVLGEEVAAIVVADVGQTAERLQEQLRGQLASFAVPSRWELRTEALPWNHAGKIDKAGVVAQARAEFAAAEKAPAS